MLNHTDILVFLAAFWAEIIVGLGASAVLVVVGLRIMPDHEEDPMGHSLCSIGLIIAPVAWWGSWAILAAIALAVEALRYLVAK